MLGDDVVQLRTNLAGVGIGIGQGEIQALDLAARNVIGLAIFGADSGMFLSELPGQDRGLRPLLCPGPLDPLTITLGWRCRLPLCQPKAWPQQPGRQQARRFAG